MTLDKDPLRCAEEQHIIPTEAIVIGVALDLTAKELNS